MNTYNDIWNMGYTGWWMIVMLTLTTVLIFNSLIHYYPLNILVIPLTMACLTIFTLEETI